MSPSASVPFSCRTLLPTPTPGPALCARFHCLNRILGRGLGVHRVAVRSRIVRCCWYEAVPRAHAPGVGASRAARDPSRTLRHKHTRARARATGGRV
jgi:hypothetical protein